MLIPFRKLYLLLFCLLAQGIILFSFSGETQAVNKSFVEGRVVSEYGPLEGARVRLPGTDDFVTTDKDGHFLLPIGVLTSRNLRITAGKEGWFNNGGFVSPGQQIELRLYPLPRGDDPHYKFLEPSVCKQCHVELTGIYEKSKMAHTASNPKVIQMYNGTDAFNRSGNGPGYKLDNPKSDGDCVSCHAPSVASAAGGTQDLNKALVSPFLETDGISCEYCHKVKRVVKNDASPSGFSAHLLRQAPNRGNSILVMGPYDDVAVPPMDATYNPIFEEGQFCSQCHSHVVSSSSDKLWDWKKVYTEAEWKGFDLKNDSILPVQTTYQEWRQWQEGLEPSDPNAGKVCQNCHMSWRKEMLPFDNYVVNGHARQMWASYRQSQQIHPHQFDGGTETQLKTAVSMEIEGKITKDILTITVYLSNTNGGHWVPTGEPMRSMMLLLEAVSGDEKPLVVSSGEILPESAGVGNIAEGNYAGLPGVRFARVLQDAKGNLDVPYWNAVAVASDNRLRPKTTVSYKWQFKLPNTEDEPSVVAKLIYRPVDKQLAKSKKWLVEDILVTDTAW